MQVNFNVAEEKKVISTTKQFALILIVFVFCYGCMTMFFPGWKSRIPEELKPPIYTQPTYELDGTHFFGPRGINEAFVVYSIPEKIAENVSAEGLEYLNNMTSTKEYEEVHRRYFQNLPYDELPVVSRREHLASYYSETFGLYKDWRATPVTGNEERWNRDRNEDYLSLKLKGLSKQQRMSRHATKYRKSTACKDTSLCSYYGDYKTKPTWAKRSLDAMNFFDDIDPIYSELVNTALTSPNSYFGYGEYDVLIVSPDIKKIFLLYRD